MITTIVLWIIAIGALYGFVGFIHDLIGAGIKIVNFIKDKKHKKD
jgi:hypothetical protein